MLKDIMIKYIYWLIICTTCIIFALETSMKSEYNMCVQTIPVHSNINTPEVMTNFMSSYTLKLRYKVFTNYFFFFKMISRVWNELLPWRHRRPWVGRWPPRLPPAPACTPWGRPPPRSPARCPSLPLSSHPSSSGGYPRAG